MRRLYSISSKGTSSKFPLLCSLHNIIMNNIYYYYNYSLDVCLESIVINQREPRADSLFYLPDFSTYSPRIVSTIIISLILLEGPIIANIVEAVMTITIVSIAPIVLDHFILFILFSHRVTSFHSSLQALLPGRLLCRHQ